MALPTPQNTTNPARWVLWSLLSALGLLVYLNHAPLILSEGESSYQAQPPKPRAAGEVLLVVDAAWIEATNRGAPWSALDLSYGWTSTLEQEFGPYALIDASALAKTDLAPYRFVILTRSVVGRAAAPSALLGHLRAYASGGGVVVLERPEGAFRETFSADGRGGLRAAKAITRAVGLAAPFAAQLAQAPLLTEAVVSSALPPDARVYLDLDGAPAIYRRPIGSGFAITLDFDYARALVALQQGRPEEDFEVLPRDPALKGDPAWARTSDLVLDPDRLTDAPAPYADLLEKYLVYGVLNDAWPVVGLWPFRDGHQGALLITHDVHDMGLEAGWMAAWEQQRGVRSTYYVNPDTMDKRDLAELLQLGPRVQLQWVRPRPEGGLFDPIGVRGLQPLARARPLREQLKGLKDKLPRSHTLVSSRTWLEGWGPTWDAPLRTLADNQLRLDISYTPPPGGRGYAFGTGLPFPALDNSGLPIGVHELPCVLHDPYDRPDPRYLQRLLRDSQEAYHQALHVRFDPDAHSHLPSIDLFDLWRVSYDLGEDAQHWRTTVTHFIQFWRERLDANIASSLRLDQAFVPLDDDSADERPLDPLVLAVEVKATEEGHVLSLPDLIQGRRFLYARWGRKVGVADLTEPLPSTTTETIGYDRRLVPLKKGYNSITATYR